jgi:hypothetical protein
MYSQSNKNQWGLRDKYDQSSGLTQVNPQERQYNLLENTLVIDTRDCIGTKSLRDARTVFIAKGGRGPAYGTILNVTATNPIVITFNSVSELRNGDVLIFQEIRGIIDANGRHTISNINTGLNTAEISAGTTSGTYSGGGIWNRAADPGYPVITDNDSTIRENTIIAHLNKEIKFIRSLTLYHIVIPRDIIPLIVYLPDFITASIDDVDVNYTVTETVWTNYIQQEQKYMETRMIGFYSSPLDLWRSYSFGGFSMQDQYTPPPLQLWNPIVDLFTILGLYQPIPYPYQTVPTLRSAGFLVPTLTDVITSIILAGYGVYDLVDWTVPGNTAEAILQTIIMRKLLLLLIAPKQSSLGYDYVDLILFCSVVDDPVVGLTDDSAYGFGNFQRYVPGPGIGQSYQPGTYHMNGIYTNGGAGVSQPNVIGTVNPNTGSSDNPVPFVNFRGNVWGPYNKPWRPVSKIRVEVNGPRFISERRFKQFVGITNYKSNSSSARFNVRSFVWIKFFCAN